MPGSVQSQSKQTITQMVNQILKDGNLSRQEYFQLVTLFLSDFSVTDEERAQINQVFDQLQMERLRFID
ncbi:MAG: hypothetical protein F6K10_07045 [Moorea sp. SIO2B7]|nr:hypothetical protein [Moorena sp. SIO2B7]